MRKIHLVVLVLVGLFASAGFVAAGGRPLSTTLSGAAEVPGPGDPDGRGRASLTINPGQGEICYELSTL